MCSLGAPPRDAEGRRATDKPSARKQQQQQPVAVSTARLLMVVIRPQIQHPATLCGAAKQQQQHAGPGLGHPDHSHLHAASQAATPRPRCPTSGSDARSRCQGLADCMPDPALQYEQYQEYRR